MFVKHALGGTGLDEVLESRRLQGFALEKTQGAPQRKQAPPFSPSEILLLPSYLYDENNPVELRVLAGAVLLLIAVRGRFADLPRDGSERTHADDRHRPRARQPNAERDADPKARIGAGAPRGGARGMPLLARAACMLWSPGFLGDAGAHSCARSSVFMSAATHKM